MKWKVIGHKNQKFFLENVLKNRNFSHAYLFAGPQQIGKKTLAAEFANLIFESTASQHINFDPEKVNPDLIIYGPEQNKIEDARNLIHGLSLKPFAFAYKIAIIDDFENFTDEAANSILKTLEEPNPTTIIILITSNKKRILPTVLSRCQALDFNRLPENELEAGKFAAVYNGKLGKKIKFEQDKDFEQRLISQSEALKKIKDQNISGRLLAIKDYSDFENPELAEILGNWLDQEQYALTHDSPEKFRNPALLAEALSGLRQNFNKKLVLEKLFLNLV